VLYCSELVVPETNLTFCFGQDKPNDLATTIVWNYAAYNGGSTVVNYSIEFATAGTNFAAPTVVATSLERLKISL
jgi:hypothetical protein